MAGALFYLVAHVVVDLHVKDIRHQIQRILIVLHFRVKASQVEAVGEVILVDLAKVFIPSRRDELQQKLKLAVSKRRLKHEDLVDVFVALVQAGDRGTPSKTIVE